MQDIKDSLRQHTSDQLGIESHILSAIERQLEDDRVKQDPGIHAYLQEVHGILERHKVKLETLLAQYDAKGRGAIKQAIADAVGVMAGLYDKLRDHPVSRMIRDDYTALNFAAMGYTSLHTFGLTVKDSQIAEIARLHLEELTPLIMRIGEILPPVVAREVAEEVEIPLDPAVGSEAARHVVEAWKPRNEIH